MLTALRKLYSAQRGYSQRRYDDLPSVLNLQRQAGRLAADDLADIDALLTIAAALKADGGAAWLQRPICSPGSGGVSTGSRRARLFCSKA